MSEPNGFYLPRRSMGIATHVPAPTSELIKLRDVGIINGAEITWPREVTEYLAPDGSGAVCRTFVAYTHTESATGTLTIEMMSDTAANLAVQLESALTAHPGAAQSETLATAAVGDAFSTLQIPDFDQPVTITDSDAGPATLVEGTDYEWIMRNAGYFRILNLGSYVQPFKIDYTSKKSNIIDPMSALDARYHIELSGNNQAAQCKGDKDVFTYCRISEDQLKRLAEPGETQAPIPTTVTFMVDRDPTRGFSFGPMARTDLSP